MRYSIDHGNKRMDQVEKKLMRLHQNPAPTVPQYDLQVTPVGPPYVYFSSTWQYKNHAAWWNADDTNNGDLSWVTGGARDVSILARFDGTYWAPIDETGSFLPGPSICGVYTPDDPALGTPYYPGGPVPVGGIGNNWTPSFSPIPFAAAVFSGDQIAVIGYQIDIGTPEWGSNPFLDVQYKIYDALGTTLLHDFGIMHIPTSTYVNPIVGGFYLYPLLPSQVWVSSDIWTVP